jgi:hypothetical protein
MFEKAIRGGFSGVLGSRLVKSFNKETSNYDNGNRIIDEYEKEQLLNQLKDKKGEIKDLSKFLKTNYLLYLDANNLYGWAMCQKLPHKDFKWEEDLDYYKNIPEGRGCIIECDLYYTKECKNKTRKYPLAPDRELTTKEELSDYQLDLLGDNNLGKIPKLQLTLKNKERYVLHYKILQFYLSQGLKITKVHRTISYKEEAWLKPYIDFNTEQRTKAKSDFEKGIFKDMNNAFYGKTMENIRERVSINLVTDKQKAVKQYSRASFKDVIIFNDNFVGIQHKIPSILFNKPIYLGMTILDYSKLLMYEFYYNVINKQFPDNEVLYSDTDSLVLNIYTEDLYKELENIKDELDTSDYPKDHPLYSDENKKVVGKFKDELGGKIMTDWIALRSKAYSYKDLDPRDLQVDEKMKLKGMSKTTIKKEIHFENFKKCLLTSTEQFHKMFTLNPINHEMYLSEVTKKSLSPFDDKRYILSCGIQTLPKDNNIKLGLFLEEMISNIKFR